MFLHTNRTHTRTTSTMRNAECFVQVKMTNICSNESWTCKTDLENMVNMCNISNCILYQKGSRNYVLLHNQIQESKRETTIIFNRESSSHQYISFIVAFWRVGRRQTIPLLNEIMTWRSGRPSARETIFIGTFSP